MVRLEDFGGSGWGEFSALGFSRTLFTAFPVLKGFAAFQLFVISLRMKNAHTTTHVLAGGWG